MKLHFGDFTLDSDCRQLLRGKASVHLWPKAFELLTLLIESRPRVLSKAELHERLWPSTFVSEANLTSLVAEIREALDDPARQPRFIRTVHGYGYGFCGEVIEPSGVSVVPRARIKCWLFCNGRQIVLSEGDNIVGRDPDADVWVDSTGVSRHHARIRVAAGQAMLEDLDSKNGTYVGPQRVTAPVPLTDGDEIRVGSVVATFRIPPDAGTTETQPVDKTV